VSDRDLMLKIRSEWGALIAEVCQASPAPPHFLAALVANESGGDASATRRENAALAAMCEVITGHRADFQGMGRGVLLAYLDLGSNISTPEIVSDLVHMATSWGLTQIMGWQEVKRGKPEGTIKDPRGNLSFALEILGGFAKSYRLDLAKDFESLFRCWNSGTPAGKTFDPNYVSNGLNRCMVYGLNA
jgi:hypothetical protein